MAIMNAYYCTLGSCTYVFKDGTAAFFNEGRYLTSLEKEIEELEAEIAAKHPHFYVNKDALTVDTDAVDPIEEEVQKRVVEIMKQRDMGDYASGGIQAVKLGVSTSASVAETAPESNSK